MAGSIHNQPRRKGADHFLADCDNQSNGELIGGVPAGAQKPVLERHQSVSPRVWDPGTGATISELGKLNLSSRTGRRSEVISRRGL